MRVVEATAGGAVAAAVLVLIAHHVGFGDLVLAGAVGFLVAFLAVLLRSDRPYQITGRR